MKIPYVISEPGHVAKETGKWTELFEAGLECLHIRKKEGDADQIEELLKDIPSAYRQFCVLHGNPELAIRYGMGGCHLAKHELSAQNTEELILSTSVHTWEEFLSVQHQVDYAFISPVFDSISKTGYVANPALANIPDQVIRSKAVALGGITPARAVKARKLGFGGVAVLGYIWSYPDHVIRFEKIRTALAI